jgi:hypothetical protein
VNSANLWTRAARRRVSFTFCSHSLHATLRSLSADATGDRCGCRVGVAAAHFAQHAEQSFNASLLIECTSILQKLVRPHLRAHEDSRRAHTPLRLALPSRREVGWAGWAWRAHTRTVGYSTRAAATSCL